MATPFSIIVEELDADYDSALSNLATGRSQYNQAKTDWTAGEDHAALSHVINCLSALLQATNRIACGNFWSYAPPFLPTALRLCWEYEIEDMPEVTVTWKSICEAWGANDFEGRVVTIAFIDRMRQLIWNEPYYVAWAAKPEEEF